MSAEITPHSGHIDRPARRTHRRMSAEITPHSGHIDRPARRTHAACPPKSPLIQDILIAPHAARTQHVRRNQPSFRTY